MHSNSKISETVLHLATHKLTLHLKSQLNQCRQHEFNDQNQLQNDILIKLLTQTNHTALQNLIRIIYNYNKKLLLECQSTLEKEELQFLSRSSTKNYVIMIIKRQIDLLIAKRQQERIVKIQYDIISNYLNLGDRNCKNEAEEEQGLSSVKQNNATQPTNQEMEEEYCIKPQENQQAFISNRLAVQPQFIISEQESLNQIENIDASLSLSSNYSLLQHCQKLHESRQFEIDTRQFDRSKQQNSTSQIHCKQQQQSQQTNERNVIIQQTQKNGHFIFGDTMQDIKCFYLIDNVIYGYITWKQRQEGNIPVDSQLSIDEIRNFIPQQLCDKLKEVFEREKKDD